MAESQEDEKELEWQQYLHSLRDRYQYLGLSYLACSRLAVSGDNHKSGQAMSRISNERDQR